MRSPGRSLLPLALLALIVAGAAAASDPPAAESSEGLVYSVTLNDALHPVTARYLKEAIQRANEAHARLVILKLDTPGGLVSSVEEMVKDITSSRVPIVVFVNGSKAASGGFFLTIDADAAPFESAHRVARHVDARPGAFRPRRPDPGDLPPVRRDRRPLPRVHAPRADRPRRDRGDLSSAVRPFLSDPAHELGGGRSRRDRSRPVFDGTESAELWHADGGRSGGADPPWAGALHKRARHARP